jgi:hypothetical protein
MGLVVSRRIECRRSMHDWDDVASDALVDIFRRKASGSGLTKRSSEQGLSNETLAKRS